MKKKTSLNKKLRAQNTQHSRSTPRSQSMDTPRGKSMNQSQRTSRAIPAQLKRQVWERDQGRCGFIGEDGHRCHETRGLEYAHLHPWAKGGRHSLDNLGLRCRGHNAYEAIQDYGVAFMQNKRHTRQPVHNVREPVQRYQVSSTESAASAGRTAWLVKRKLWGHRRVSEPYDLNEAASARAAPN